MQNKTNYESIVLIGKITCGKGTQAKAIIDNFGGTMFSIGNKVRELSAMDTPLGHKMKESYESGLLAPNWLASYWMMHALLHRHGDDRLIFEAVARKPDEAEIFHEIHEWTNRPYIVFNLDVPDTVVHRRSEGRSRDVVDSTKGVEKRLEEFNEFTTKSLDIFRSHGNVVDIDGTMPIEEVTKKIFEHLTKN
ncbi:nucleoside monophosphate kinase [Candidatus Kaiserbacteria bacterium]|nr:nucleoside monophosphate kinase [Candidatus Kaiserbacteria bacterium]